MFRIAFDPELPVVAAQAFTAGGRAIVQGETLDWRAMGIDEDTLHAWWTSGLVAHPIEQPAPGETVLEQRDHKARTRTARR